MEVLPPEDDGVAPWATATVLALAERVPSVAEVLLTPEDDGVAPLALAGCTMEETRGCGGGRLGFAAAGATEEGPNGTRPLAPLHAMLQKRASKKLSERQ